MTLGRDRDSSRCGMRVIGLCIAPARREVIGSSWRRGRESGSIILRGVRCSLLAIHREVMELGSVAVSTGAPPPASSPSSFPETTTLIDLKETKSLIWII